ncbi:hypothetical protein FBQ80_02105 [Candidatus Brocadia sp. AMX2]|nr:hypothetical protein [Candidatus Brocadia sp. AMX2]
MKTFDNTTEYPRRTIMKNFVPRVIVIFFVLCLRTGTSVSHLYAQTDRQLAVISQLKQIDPTIKIRWDDKTGAPVRLAGKLSEKIDADAKEIAIRFFKTNKALFHMTDTEQELTIRDVNKDERGWEHVKLQQIYKSLPVEGKQILVHINSNKEVQVVNGHYLPNIDVNTSPSIQSSDAITAIFNAAKRDLKLRTEPVQEPKAELIVYNYNDKTHLAWKARLKSEDPLGEFVYYVDAHTGDVIHFYNDLQFVLSRKTYDGKNGAALPGTLKRSEGDISVGDAALDAAHENAGTVYNYYNNNHGRDSYDNSGAILRSTVHHKEKFNNAYWSPFEQQMVYGDGDGTVFSPLSQALDVVAHELTHAVTGREAGLIYENQSGALNESLSDIFGVLIDPLDWMLGEDIFTPGTPGDALRYMDNPPRGNQPDHMDDFVVPDSNGSNLDKRCYDSNDRYNGCVHFNSGIPNKAAYLMSEGGTHHGIAVQGMGLFNVGKVFYEAQINWLTSNSDFMEAREATLDAVAVIFPGDTPKYITVQNAWAAVGIGNPNVEEVVTQLEIITAPPPPTNASIGSPGEKDIFGFTVVADGQYTIETGGKTDTYMSLFGPNNRTTLVAENDDIGGNNVNSRISKVLTAGNYFAEIRHYSSTGVGAYTIKVQAGP